jgi:hypothetical protein
MASRTVELKLRVTYEYDDVNKTVIPPAEDCLRLLRDVVEQAAMCGTLSGDTDLTVEDYKYTVETVATDED